MKTELCLMHPRDAELLRFVLSPRYLQTQTQAMQGPNSDCSQESDRLHIQIS